MKYTLLVSFLFLMSFSSSDKQAFKIFDRNGKNSSYEKLLKEAKNADIVFFGEMHNNPICHWLELELARDLYKDKKEKLVLGAEMFEADCQGALNDYLSDKIKDEELKTKGRTWPNYLTDYKPLVELAKTNKIPFIATNVPRKYASMVYKNGMAALDTIPSSAKAWLAPLPYKFDPELKCYKDIFAAAGGHGGQNLPMSQALKDATMAYFILQNWKSGQTFLHFNGAYHTNDYLGIVWYLKQSNPNLKIMTISSVEQDGVESLKTENLNLANFIINVPESMTKTY